MKHPLWLRLLSPVLVGLILLSALTGCTPPCKHSAAESQTLRPTCTESGYERIVCTDCHEVLAETILSPLGHTPVWHTDLVADCFHQGHLRSICSECGAILEESYTEPSAHVWEETGTAGILRCADCGVIRSESFENELPVFLISTAQELTQNKEYVDCTVSLVNTSQEHAFLDSSAKIRVRGNNTATQKNKLPYKLKFDKKVQLLGLGGGKAKEWVLLAELFDPTSLRNYFSLSMGRKLDHIGFCSDCTFAEVYIDGVYKGVYLVAEQNEIGTHRVNIEETEEADTPFYIVCDNADVENGTAGADCFEIMTPEQYPVYFVVKNQNATPLQVQAIKEYMENAYRLVIEGTREEIEAAFDIPSFVDSTILQMFVLDPDTVMRSFYYVKGADGKLACTSPWDFDLAYGNFAGFEDWTDV
ncbi:MAG: CotH kinase family protein, partial [Christensenellaceae bacterium]